MTVTGSIPGQLSTHEAILAYFKTKCNITIYYVNIVNLLTPARGQWVIVVSVCLCNLRNYTIMLVLFSLIRTFQMTVSNSLVGRIIGKKGLKINQIQVTSCTVHVNKTYFVMFYTCTVNVSTAYVCVVL